METEETLSDEVWQRIQDPAPTADSRQPGWFFHSHCQRCEDEDGAFDSPSCLFCSHFRLRHLLKCILDNEKAGNITFRLKDFDDMAAQLECDFCQYMAGFISRRDGGKKKAYRLTLNSDHIDMNWDAPTYGFLDNAVISEDGRNWRGVEDSEDDGMLLLELPDKLKIEDLKRWFDSSRESWYNAPLLETPPPGFKVIDLQRLCISSLPKGAAFAALSYVWGAPSASDKTFETTTANVRRLEEEGGLGDELIPQTIRDAMTVAAGVGLRYLWVDRLCIVQDDQDTKPGQLVAMGRIYQHALLTIVAAAGDDAHYGLAGISRSRDTNPFNAGRFHGFKFVEVLPQLHKTILPATRWGQRGWTFQEGVCSTRILFFTDVGLFAEQRTDTGQRFWTSEAFAEQDQQVRLHGYHKWVERYTKRSLTYPTDILWAFLGLFDHMPSTEALEQRYGLPVSQFDLAILWKQINGDAPRRASSGTDIFPSWSWTSSTGEISYDEKELDLSASVASWVFVDEAPNGYALSAVSFADYPVSMSGARYEVNQLVAPMLVAWNYTLPSWGEEQRKSAEEICQTLSRMRFKNTPELWYWARGVSPQSETEQTRWERPNRKSLKAFRPRPPIEAPRGGLQKLAWYDLLTDEEISVATIPGRVIVRTTSAFLDMERLQKTSDGNTVFLLRINGDDECIGQIELPDSAVQEVDEGKGDDGRSRMEFIALSLRGKAPQLHFLNEMPAAALDPQENKISWGAWNSPTVLNVMLITRSGRVAQRLAIGAVSLKGWSKTSSQLSNIILK
ncbi:Heterokaryon incompatibility [Macrophomina phaseolina MS6]|uniref:Heterokaryon incompatibility n=1 Tax=Macrophomina phaseolina (strain MS6) TaxID=1126212 RepID=K2RZ09_MACPH|nr:Heterokaryon incompatibility [Macrophomina phaseolina MS6]